MPTGKKVSTFQERFSELVESSDKTITEIAKELHVSGQTVSAWKLGVRSPKEPTIITIANHFRVNVQWLMGFDVLKHENFTWQKTEDPKIRIVSGAMESLSEEQKEQIVAIVLAAVTHMK